MISKDIPIIEYNEDSFIEDFENVMEKILGSSAHRNDIDRPYDGQSHTSHGTRGMEFVNGLTMRDIRDCLVKAMLVSGSEDGYLNKDFNKCWDYSEVKTDNDIPKPTQFLLDKIKDNKYVSTKVELGIWSEKDLYYLPWEQMDPVAICQNLTCEIEKMMGIFPNIKLENKE